MKILQKFYPELEIDTNEKDIVQIYCKNDVIQIERENIELLISILEKQI